MDLPPFSSPEVRMYSIVLDLLGLICVVAISQDQEMARSKKIALTIVLAVAISLIEWHL